MSNVADFGSVTMSDCIVDMGDKIGNFGYFPSERIFMYDTNGTRLADVSDYNSNASSFTVTHLTSQ